MNGNLDVEDGFARYGTESILLDVTRLVALKWTGRHATGIDRVCLAYLRHYRNGARAVLQHRGVVRVLDADASAALFDLLDGPTIAAAGRSRLAIRLGRALLQAKRSLVGSVYLNVGHTDFDLAEHARWVTRHRLRAFYLIHDLIPINHPRHCRPHAVARHTGRVLGALRHGCGVIVGSGAVEKDLRDFAWSRQLSPPPVVTAHLAGAELPQPDDVARGDHFICVGTIESRKNHVMLLDLWERLAARLGPAAPRLTIAGQWGFGSSAVRERLDRSATLRALVDVVDQCDDRALVRLVAGARAVLMPTLAEGFGLPMVEALAMGVPVVASDLPCFREIGRGVPRLLSPDDLDAWERCVVALDAPAARRRRRIDALHDYRAPSWTEHFARVDAFLNEAGSIASSRGASAPVQARHPRLAA